MPSPRQGMMQAQTSRRHDTSTVKGIAVKVKMDKYLARWGFTPQKPIKRAYEQIAARGVRTGELLRQRV